MNKNNSVYILEVVDTDDRQKNWLEDTVWEGKGYCGTGREDRKCQLRWEQGEDFQADGTASAKALWWGEPRRFKK